MDAEFLKLMGKGEITRDSLLSMQWWLDKDDFWNPPISDKIRAIDYGEGTRKLTFEFLDDSDNYREAEPQPRTLGELHQLMLRLDIRP